MLRLGHHETVTSEGRDPAHPGQRAAPADGKASAGADGAAASPRRPLPADPAAYDHPRAELARAKGLETPYIPGGDDPEPESARREERILARVLLVMVIAIILAGFVLGALGTLLAPPG